MNGLSWLLYGAEVFATLKTTLSIAIPTAAIGGTIGLIMWGTLGAETYHYDSPEAKAAKAARPAWAFKAAKKLWLALVVGSLVGILLPGHNTLMLIAASEVGETVLASKDVQNIGGEAGELATDSLRLLRKYVSEQLGETEAN